MFDRDLKGGGMMRSQIPAFRLPADVLEEEVDLIVNMGVNMHYGYEITSMKDVLDLGYDAYFVGTGAPRGRDLDMPGRTEVDEHISIGIDWLIKRRIRSHNIHLWQPNRYGRGQHCHGLLSHVKSIRCRSSNRRSSVSL